MKNYKLKTESVNELNKYGFKYSRENNIYVYRVVGCSYHSQPLIFIDFLADVESKSMRYNIVSRDGNTYYPYYNNYLNQSNKVIAKIDSVIKNEIYKMSKKGILTDDEK